MIIEYYDGGKLHCSRIEVSSDGKTLYADEEYIVPLIEVLRITEDEEA